MMIAIRYQLAIAQFILLPFLIVDTTSGQELEFVKELRPKGTIEFLRRGHMVIVNEDGKTQSFKVQDGDSGAISLNEGALVVNAPAEIQVTGRLDASVIQRGWPLKFRVTTTRAGRIRSAVDRFEFLPSDAVSAVQQITAPQSTRDPFEAEIVGRVISVSEKNLKVLIPENDVISKKELVVPLAEGASVELRDNDLGYVRAGDIVSSCLARETRDGDRIIFEIHIELVPREKIVSSKISDQLNFRFGHLSDVPPSQPRLLTSKHFQIHTDVSEREGRILLAKLETMVELVSGYYDTPPRQEIECFVIKDLDKWPRNHFDERTVRKIEAKEGYTITASRGNERKSIVYSYADHAIVQHEAVHAYCGQSFKTTGPFWYSEGMAELGKYWRHGERAVSIHPAVVEYLRGSKRVPLQEVLGDQQVAARGWQDYAWRWSICHLLANNSNYLEEFKRIGPSLMNERGPSFAEVFGERSQQLRFEYNQFVDLLQNGLRADLIAWQWNVRVRKLSGSKRARAQIKADYGWQATPVLIEPGKSYTIEAEGEWQLSDTEHPVDANGTAGSRGKLIGVLFRDFELGEPFEVGKNFVIESPTEGQLYLRCYDDWAQLDDNSGEIEVTIRLKKD